MTEDEARPLWSPHMDRVAVLPWPGIENAFLCVSGKTRRRSRYGDKWYPANEPHREEVQRYEEEPTAEAAISFTYVGKNVAAEWDGELGPIQMFFRREEGWKEEDGWQEAKPHWLWPFASGQGAWSQLAVERADLPACFRRGDYAAIFNELRSWVESREPHD